MGCRLKVVTGPKGTRVTLRHAETLNTDGSLCVANLRSAKAADIYTLKGGRRSLRAALHLSWLPLCGSHRFPGEPVVARSRARGARRHGSCRASSPVPTNCSIRSTTTCSGASAAATAASRRLSAARRRQGCSTTAPGEPQRELHVRCRRLLREVDDRPEDSQRPNGSIPDVSPTTGRSTMTASPGRARWCSSTACSTTNTGTSACWHVDTAMKKWMDYEKTFVKTVSPPKIPTPTGACAGRSQADSPRTLRASPTRR